MFEKVAIGGNKFGVVVVVFVFVFVVVAVVVVVAAGEFPFDVKCSSSDCVIVNDAFKLTEALGYCKFT